MKIRNVILAVCASTLLFAAAAHAQSGVGIHGVPVGIDHDDPAGLKAKRNNGTLPKQKATGNTSGASPKKQAIGEPIQGTSVGLDKPWDMKANSNTKNRNR